MTSKMTYPSASGFDPAALLAPKANAKIMRTKEEPVIGAKDEDDLPEVSGMASMIERVHNVENRTGKRRKLDHGTSNIEDDDLVEVKQKKEQFNGIGGTGAMGQYLKDKNKELKGSPEKTREEIDLTLETSDVEDEDDEVIYLGDITKDEVCLGRIENTRVNAHKVPTPKASKFQRNQALWMAMSVSLHRRPGSHDIIGVRDPMQNDFGNIDQRTGPTLARLMDGAKVSRLRLLARLDVRPRKPFDYPGQAISDHFAITINVYAEREYVAGIGALLMSRGIWLRDPLAVERNMQICNPHKSRNGLPQKPIKPKGTSVLITRTQEEVRGDVLKLFDTLKDTKDWPEMEAPNPVLTQLLSHQKQAMYFLNKRERLPLVVGDRVNTILDDDEEMQATATEIGDDGEAIWQKKTRSDGSQRWVNAITGHAVRNEPSPILGGIFADVMGLGKTLNILSLIAGSFTQAKEWSRQTPEPSDDPQHEGIDIVNSKATLLICPLSTIVNWEEQIKKHLKKNSIEYYLYQGPGRTKNARMLRKYDLVITTYQCVGSEFGRTYRDRPNKPLFETNWFRIVLDEAHQIRNSSAMQSIAACALRAQRRWCVTGTPVQNRLEDLGALIKFLKIKPFDEQGNFARYISTPLRTGNADTIPKLRVLVDLITIRRLKDKLNLPERIDTRVLLKMTDAERNLYEQFARDSRSKMDAMAGEKKTLGGKSYAQALKAILRLRMICAHGADMLSDDDWEFARGFDALNTIDLEDDDDFKPDKTPQQAFEMYRLMKDANVAFCSRCISPIEPRYELEELEDGEDETLGFLTPCNQLLCRSCVKTWQEEMQPPRVGPDNRGVCTICDNYIRVTLFEIKQRALAEDGELHNAVQATKFAKNLARYQGPHSKTSALLAELEKDRQWSENHAEARPIKSVVFSEWTTHLDLIQMAFTNAKVNYTRLDGSTSLKDRSSALGTFETSDEINVILVSLKAGGLGLNLTAASRVYVMEPNYNPQAELQAIERVHRLGQKRDVKITRFIMERSVEEKVVELQVRKMKLAKFTFDGDRSLVKASSTEKSRKTLEEIKDLLR